MNNSDEQPHRGPPERFDPAMQRFLGALAAKPDRAQRRRNTRLPRPTIMLATNAGSGTPTMPEAQVNILSGTGRKPASTSVQNAVHGCSVRVGL